MDLIRFERAQKLAAEGEQMAPVPQKYQEALLRNVRRESAELSELRKHWSGPTGELKKHRELLKQKIKDNDDPILLPLDLLSPIGFTTDERIHTLALAYLLNPKPTRDHALGKEVLVAVLSQVGHDVGAKVILKLVRARRTVVSVIPEYRYREEGHPNRTVSRCDIGIEIRSQKHHALVIIENKIDAQESPGQLTWYEGYAKKWCKNRAPAKSLLLYLTRDGTEPKTSKHREWVSLSYVNLASALRRAWLSSKPGARGRDWLGLYIATITGGILGIDMSDPSGSESEIETYVGSAP